MSKLFLGPEDNLLSALGKIREVPSDKVELAFAADSPLLANRLNLRILKREAEKMGKDLVFESAAAERISAGLPEGGISESETSAFGFVEGEDVAADSPVDVEKSSIFRFPLPPLFPKKLSFNLNLKLLRILGPLAVFLFLLATPALAFFFLSRATVTLVVNSEILAKSIELTASAKAEAVDEDERVIPAVRIEVSREEKLEGEATGKKEVGEKAKGLVTLYNKTDTEEAFPKGAVISKGRIEGEDLRFLLDNDATVPARTATGSAEAITYFSGRAEVSVTAEEIGEEYNLPKGETFNVKGFSTNDYIAQSYADFSGGSKRTVSVVAKEDEEELEKRLKAELEKKLKSDLEGRLVGDQKLEEGAVGFAVISKSFNKDVGEEARKLELTLKVGAVGLAYSQEQLQNLLGRLLEEFVADRYELSSSDKTVEVFGAAVEKGAGGEVLKFTAKVRGFVIPKIERERLKRDLAGKSAAWSRNYLSNLPNIAGHSINLFPPRPSFLGYMPLRPERIKIEVVKR